MTDLIGRTLHRLNLQLPGRVSVPGNDRYARATAIWAKSNHTPRAIAHCQTAAEVQAAIRAARNCDLPLSVRGGGHDWAGRALCDGLVIDLSGMNRVELYPEISTARVGGGTRASGLLEAVEPFGMAAVTGACGPVGMAGLAQHKVHPRFLDLHAGVVSHKTLPKPYLTLRSGSHQNLARTLPLSSAHYAPTRRSGSQRDCEAGSKARRQAPVRN